MSRLLAGLLAVILKTTAMLVLAVAIICVVTYSRYWNRASEYDLKNVGKIPERSIVYDADGHIYAWIQGENRILIPLSRVPDNFINALLAREDTRFWNHGGVDLVGIMRAAIANVHGKTVRQGASTITQQLARNSFGLTARTIDRKLVEAMLATRIERMYSKRQILEFYINRVYFGAGVYGLERAAQVYFGKSAHALTLSESALLAGIIRSPNRMSPITNPNGALLQRNEVLNRMASLGMVTGDTVTKAKSTPIRVTGRRGLPSQQSYVMDAVRRDLDLILTQDQIDQGGLRIYTTIDPSLQKLAERAVAQRTAEIESRAGWAHPLKAEFDATYVPDSADRPTPYLQAALLAIDNRSGAIRALVGGRDYSQSKFDRATLAHRQVGSTFKPFVYASAFQRGLLPGSLVQDCRIAAGEFRDLPKNWSPENSDGDYGGWEPASYGLINSRNTMSVRVGEYAGLDFVRSTAKLCGLGKDITPYPVVFLGGFDATLKDLTTAYTVFPNRGERLQSFLISRIENADGVIVFQVSHARVHALGRGTAWLTSELLQKVLKTGTGAKAARLGLTKPAAGKTGTTNEYRDAWFVGYTSSLTCGVWVGFDKPETIMEKGYGATLALPIWIDLIQSAPESQYPAHSLSTPEFVTRVRVCSVSGGLATAGCDRAQTSYTVDLPSGLVPQYRCTVHDNLIPVLAAIPLSTPPPWLVNGNVPRSRLVVTGINEIPDAPLSIPPSSIVPRPGLAPPRAVPVSPSRPMIAVFAGQPTRVITQDRAQPRRNSPLIGSVDGGIPVMRALPVRPPE